MYITNALSLLICLSKRKSKLEPLLALEFLHGVLAERATQVHVVGHDAERRLVALTGELRVGGRGADLRDAGIALEDTSDGVRWNLEK
jgi:hypothetical protein